MFYTIKSHFYNSADPVSIKWRDDTKKNNVIFNYIYSLDQIMENMFEREWTLIS